METRIETLSGHFATAPEAITIDDLPFPRAGLAAWVGSTSVATQDTGTQLLVDAFIDKNSGAVYDRGGDNAGVIAVESSPSGLPVLAPRVEGAPGSVGYVLPPGFAVETPGRTMALIGKRPTATVTTPIVREFGGSGLTTLTSLDEIQDARLRIIGRRDPSDSGGSAIVDVPVDEWYYIYVVFDYASGQIRYQVNAQAEVIVSAFTDGSGPAPIVSDSSRRIFRQTSIVGQYYDLILLDQIQSPVARAMTQNYLRSMTNILNGV